jgi:hypothetical protein
MTKRQWRSQPCLGMSRKIHLLVDGNPRRKGKATYKIFALYRNGMTVGDFIKKGGRMIDVVADMVRKHIKVG